MQRTTLLLAGLGLSLSGCGKLEDFKNTVEGLTENFVIEGIYLGVAEYDGELDLEALGFGGAKIVGYLADAAQISEIEQAPITGMDLRLLSDVSGGSNLIEDGAGKYSLSHEEGLTYNDGEYAVLSTSYDGEDRKAGVITPPAPDLSEVPLIHTAGNPMAIDLSGQGYDTAMIVVIETESGETTFSNEPEGIEELYEMTHPDGITFSDDVETDDSLIIEIPERGFSQEGIYVLGIAGLVTSGKDDMEGVNTALSTLVAGKFRFVTVCTDEYEKLCPE